MINQVGSSSYPRVFRDFKQPANGWYMPMDKIEEKKERKRSKTIVFSLLGAGFGILALMKGAMSKTFSKYLDKWSLKLQQKMSKDSKLNNFYRFSIGKMKSFRDKSESINNFTSLKDVLFQKLMFGKNGQRTFTRRIHEGITRLFDKISRKTVNSSYAKTGKKFASLNEHMAEINERILAQNPQHKNLIEQINHRMSQVNSNLDKGFGINARNGRLEEMKKATDGLFDYFWNASVSDIRNFRSKNMYQSFIADDFLHSAKNKLAKDTSVLRRAITHDIIDAYKVSLKNVDNIQKYVSPTDMKTNNIMGSLRNNLEKYRKLSGSKEITERSKLNTEILDDLQKLSQEFKGEPKAKQAVSEYIAEIQNAVVNNQKGEMQEILSLYKKVLPRNEYLKLKEEVNAAARALDKSIDIETVQYFDKARDLKLGSAPTDILSILGTVGAVGWFLGKAKDKDERYSVALKYGIPAVGAIATSLYCTASLISGGKALLFGLLSGWAISKLGVVADNTRKKYSLDVSLQNKTIVKPQPDKV